MEPKKGILKTMEKAESKASLTKISRHQGRRHLFFAVMLDFQDGSRRTKKGFRTCQTVLPPM